MRFLKAWLRRLSGVAGFGRRDRDIRAELEAHRALEADELRHRGIDEETARRLAAAHFGAMDAAIDAYRDRRGLPALEDWVRDTMFAGRSLRRSPLVVASIVLVFGLGVGFSAAITTLVHAVLWQGLPVQAPDRVVKLALTLTGQVNRRVMGELSSFSYPEFTTLSASSRTIPMLGAEREEPLVWQGDAESVRVRARLVAGSYFAALRVRPERGRLLDAADAQSPVAVVSDRFWRQSLDAMPAVLGKPLVLDRVSYTIVGVMDPTFTGADVNPVDVWLPLEGTIVRSGRADLLEQQNVSWLRLVGRLDDGATYAAANAEAATNASRFEGLPSGGHAQIHVARATRTDPGLADSSNAQLAVGATATTLIAVLLLICGSNAAALLLARGATREREIALRMALGSGRAGILRAVVAELMIFGIVSAITGMLVAAGSLRLLRAWLPPVDALVPHVSVSWPIAALSIGFTVAVVAIFGLAPARQALRVDCLRGLQGRGAVGAPGMRLRRTLVGVQVALSLSLLLVSAVFTRSLVRSLHVEPGYALAGLAIVESGPASITAGRADEASRTFVRTLKAQLASQGTSAALAMTAPFFGLGVSTVRVADRPEPITVAFNRTDPDFFKVLGVAPLAGRLLTNEDVDVVVVNTRLARILGPNARDAVGRRLLVPRPDAPGHGGLHDVMVVGVVPDLQTATAGESDRPSYYESLPAAGSDARFLIVRSRDRSSPAREVIALARAIDPTAFVRVVSVSERIAMAMAPARIAASAAGLVGLLALLVAAVGIHGMVSHLVAIRTREIGVRLALGAGVPGLVRLLMRSTMRGVMAGAAVAAAAVFMGALAVPRDVRVTIGVAPLDPIAWASALSLLGVVTLVAAYLPARRAVHLRPLDALRDDR